MASLLRAWLRLPALIAEILAELRLLREYLGLLARPPVEAIVCACGHTASSYATDAAGVHTCLECYRRQCRERDATELRLRLASLDAALHVERGDLVGEQARLAALSEAPRDRMARDQLTAAIAGRQAQIAGLEASRNALAALLGA